MSDYSFMKTGFDLTESSNVGENLMEDVTAIVFSFMENAMRSAAIYIKHCKRNGVTQEDIKRALMLEIFLFRKRDNIMKHILEIKNEILKEEEDDDEEYDIEDIVIPENELDSFKESECDCGICQCLNKIYIRWDKFEPHTNIEKLMKNHINEMNL
jgi:hypothetical protein